MSWRSLPLLGVGLLALAAVSVAVVFHADRPRPTPLVDASGYVVVDFSRQGIAAGKEDVSIPVPPGGVKGQKKAPCVPQDEQDIDGRCWMPHRRTPPCGVNLYEWRKGCYAAIVPGPKPGVSEP